MARPERELSIRVGVLAEKRKSKSPWAEDYWMPVGVMPAATNHKEGAVLVRDETMTRYFMGTCELNCYAADTEAYVHNFNSRAPALFVVLRRDYEKTHPLPWFVQEVTASPYIAQDYGDAGEDIVERVAMPQEIFDAIREFVELHHVEHEFKKRKRGPKQPASEKFGQEPIFVRRNRPTGGKLDG